MVNKKIDFDDYLYVWKKHLNIELRLSEICKFLPQITKRQHINNLKKFIEKGYIQKIPYWNKKKIVRYKHKLTGKLPPQFKDEECLLEFHKKKLIESNVKIFMNTFDYLSNSYINQARKYVFELFYNRKQ
ncbi:hypothetical protein LCGC14_2715320 [marine sediment metagenome]|uniref:Uncharacterized protein n=1 Tax=marine sediment metagenome TaxID=412755 RepID=A0A0F8ZZD1_9ZZZZ